MIKNYKPLDIDDPFLKGWSIPEDVCDNLVNFFHSNKNLYHDVNRKDRKWDKKPIKISTDISIMEQDIEKYKEVKDYMDTLSICIKNYVSGFPCLRNGHSLGIRYGWNIQYYKPNQGFFPWHYERAPSKLSQERVLVFMTYLNTVENGGTFFQHQQLKLEARKGNTVIWPADWTYTHRGEICDTDKFIATGWLSYIDYVDELENE